MANETFGPDKQALTDVKNKIREEFGRQRAVPNENVPQVTFIDFVCILIRFDPSEG